MSKKEKSENKTNYHVFKSRGGDGTLSLDNGKKVSHNELIDLDEDDMHRSVIKDMIQAGKNEETSKDQLIKLIYPKELKEEAEA